ncbi:MAG: hypothetical protein Q9169_001487 [Polycauliona sp. 2 TL-2023]
MGGGKPQTPSTSLPKLVARPVGQQIHSIYKERLGQFTSDGQYSSQNLQAAIYEGRASGDEYVKLQVYSPPDLSRPTFEEATTQTFEDTHVGASFGPSWSTHWIKVELKVPQNLQKKERLEFLWDANNEGLIWTEKGEPLQGLTGGDKRRIQWILPDNFRDGKSHRFYIEMACNNIMGNAIGDIIQPPPPDRYFQLTLADIVAVNLEARALFVDFWIVGDAAREFPEDSWEGHQALQVCNEIMDTFIAGRGAQDSILRGREIAREYIGDVDSSDVYKSGKEPHVYAVGHCHIDTTWLWPWAETKRKIARSWSNQCDLLDRYPEHRFTCSQAQQYKWLETLYPSLYDRVKSKVKEGTFQPIGGSWVEHDTNLPGGESLVRQFLYGQRYFESRFGERCKTFWLPDTFGYSSQLPQLCRLAGMGRFFTQKLSWNNINTFPHTTFSWVSLDGSQVLCHMAPDETYTAEAHFGDVNRSISQHKSMDQDDTGMLVFGYGDGGGGPTSEMLEKLRRCRGLSDKTGRLPRVTMGDSVDDYFARLEKKAENGTEFVTWYGELYLELHRGTYTSQANNKRNNRQCEIMLHDIEYLATAATFKDKKYQYPKKAIDNIWEDVLLCQFHDTLPGSSIEQVYRDSDELYAKVFKAGEKLLEGAMSALELSTTTSHGGELKAINTLPWWREEIAKIPGTDEFALVSGGPGVARIEREFLPGISRFSASIEKLREGVFQLSNKQFRVTVEDGAITSLVDLHEDRELIPQGQKANQLVIFDDKPLYWQAWDVEVYHLRSRQELRPSKSYITGNGPHMVSLCTETRISGDSWVKTTISLASNVRDEPSYIEMSSEVEWRESMKFLKVEFPVDIRNTEASYETQFGINRRPTHYNTNWDMAKFEVCCHRWADLSEAGYGVSILNDSKYGFATSGNLMRLSLLRAPKAPDAHADMGRHHIRYAILPHAGPLDSRTVRTARNFNHPLKFFHGPSTPRKIYSELNSLQLTGSPALILDTIKRGEDDEDVSQGELPNRKGRSVIIRVYESLGGKARGTIRINDEFLPVKKIEKVNLLEDDGEAMLVEYVYDPILPNQWVCKIELRAFEVATFRLQL